MRKKMIHSTVGGLPINKNDNGDRGGNENEWKSMEAPYLGGSIVYEHTVVDSLGGR
jgi:hypothetical protein